MPVEHQKEGELVRGREGRVTSWTDDTAWQGLKTCQLSFPDSPLLEFKLQKVSRRVPARSTTSASHNQESEGFHGASWQLPLSRGQGQEVATLNSWHHEIKGILYFKNRSSSWNS